MIWILFTIIIMLRAMSMEIYSLKCIIHAYINDYQFNTGSVCEFTFKPHGKQGVPCIPNEITTNGFYKLVNNFVSLPCDSKVENWRK